MAKRKTNRRARTVRPALTQKKATRSARRPMRSKPATRSASSRSKPSAEDRDGQRRPPGIPRKRPPAGPDPQGTRPQQGRRARDGQGHQEARRKPATNLSGRVQAVKKALLRPQSAPPAQQNRPSAPSRPPAPDARGARPDAAIVARHGPARLGGPDGPRRSTRRVCRSTRGMTPALTGGDVDVDWENAYFSGDEAPGGDNPTPDQERRRRHRQGARRRVSGRRGAARAATRSPSATSTAGSSIRPRPRTTRTE